MSSERKQLGDTLVVAVDDLPGRSHPVHEHFPHRNRGTPASSSKNILLSIIHWDSEITSPDVSLPLLLEWWMGKTGFITTQLRSATFRRSAPGRRGRPMEAGAVNYPSDSLAVSAGRTVPIVFRRK